MNAPRTHLFARIIVAGVAAVLLAGCAETLMPTPVGFDKNGGDPFLNTLPSRQTTQLSVLVAADRKPAIHDASRGDPASKSGWISLPMNVTVPCSLDSPLSNSRPRNRAGTTWSSNHEPKTAEVIQY